MRDIISMSRVNALAKTVATQNQNQLGLPDKGRAIKEVGCLQYVVSRAFGPDTSIHSSKAPIRLTSFVFLLPLSYIYFLPFYQIFFVVIRCL